MENVISIKEFFCLFAKKYFAFKEGFDQVSISPTFFEQLFVRKWDAQLFGTWNVALYFF